MSGIYINNQPGNNKTVNTLGNQFTVYLNPPLMLDPTKKYQMALLNGSIVYCNPNVINRYLRFTYKRTDYDMQVPNGIYDVPALNTSFQNLTASLYPTNGLFSIEPLTSTLQVCVYSFMIMPILN